MNVLITGASGQIGTKLISFLLKSTQHNIRALAHKEGNNTFDPRVDICYGDITQIDSLYGAVKDIDIVVHLAGITHTHRPSKYFDVNVNGIDNLITVCEQLQISKFINIGSRTAAKNAGAYAHSKLLAEHKLKESKLNWITLRIGEVYGDHIETAISKITKIIEKHFFIPIIGDGSYKICPIHINDVIYAISLVIEKNELSNKSYTIAGPREYTYEEFIDVLVKSINKKRFKLHVPIFFVKLISYLFRLLNIDVFVSDQIPRLLSKKSSDISSAERDLNFRPRQFLQ